MVSVSSIKKFADQEMTSAKRFFEDMQEMEYTVDGDAPPQLDWRVDYTVDKEALDLVGMGLGEFEEKVEQPMAHGAAKGKRRGREVRPRDVRGGAGEGEKNEGDCRSGRRRPDGGVCHLGVQGHDKISRCGPRRGEISGSLAVAANREKRGTSRGPDDVP